MPDNEAHFLRVQRTYLMFWPQSEVTARGALEVDERDDGYGSCWITPLVTVGPERFPTFYLFWGLDKVPRRTSAFAC